MKKIKMLILIFLVLIILACDDAELLFGEEMAAEIEAEFDALKEEAKQEVEGAISDGISDIRETVKEEIKEEIEDILPKRETYSRKEVLEKVLSEHGSLPVLPKKGSAPPSELELQCVYWAKVRRISLGGKPIPPATIPGLDGGAKNYISKFSKSIIKIDQETLKDQILEEGALLVLGPNSGGAGYFGHIAVIEVVQNNGVWVSEQNWPYKKNIRGNYVYNGQPNHDEVRPIPLNKLIGLYIIPKLAVAD